MVYPIRFVIVLILLVSNPMIITAKEMKYNDNSITVQEIKKKVDFKVVTPNKVPNDWTLEIKTYSWEGKGDFNQIGLHYMNSTDTKLMVAIGQSKEDSSYGVPKSTLTQQVDINGIKGYFSEWGNSGELDHKGEDILGGLLCWKKDGTYIQMESSRISKKQMIDIARLMK
ncbi:DUF4367 domain-containing protein [Bacillus seohaeanensis]|uniref:DUF4367 domain-containing protein n=1 Tax=Bacillus seohaeanensis TaxID=284580 RepID=A0ABW5RTU8_9BACI